MSVERDIYYIEDRLIKHTRVRRVSGKVVEVGHMVKHGKRTKPSVKEYIDAIHNHFTNRHYQVDEIFKPGVGTAIRIQIRRCTLI